MTFTDEEKAFIERIGWKIYDDEVCQGCRSARDYAANEENWDVYRIYARARWKACLAGRHLTFACAPTVVPA